MEMINTIKTFIVTLVMAVVAYLKPIEGEELTLFLIFLVNFIAGYLSGMLANHESFNIKKALRCLGEATMFFTLCAAIFFIGDHKHNMAGALQCISFITYTVLYFYLLNVLRNIKLMLKPDTEAYNVVAFLYYILSIEFIKKIPYLENFIKINSKAK